MTDINIIETEIGGFKCLNFLFERKDARVIFPNTEKNGKWTLKTEYAGAGGSVVPYVEK